MSRNKKQKIIAPCDEHGNLWCYVCRKIAMSENFCLLGPMIENCASFKYDRARDKHRDYSFFESIDEDFF